MALYCDPLSTALAAVFLSFRASLPWVSTSQGKLVEVTDVKGSALRSKNGGFVGISRHKRLRYSLYPRTLVGYKFQCHVSGYFRSSSPMAFRSRETLNFIIWSGIWGPIRHLSLKITKSLAIFRLRKPLKTPTRMVGHGISTRDLPNASLVRYHGATSLGVISFPYRQK